MKAIMYHYVRPQSGGMPYFRYLALDSFRRQLDHFAETEGFVEKDAFLESLTTGQPVGKGVVLTFDDGFSDHYDYVLPELKKRGLWGIFYIPTHMYATGQLLDVHRIHVLLGKFGGEAILSRLRHILSDTMLSHNHVAEFHNMTYATQDNDQSTSFVKRTLNYFISYEYREKVLDDLMEMFFGREQAIMSEFYMSDAKIKAMQDEGMMIGSHSVTHPVFSKLDEEAQRRELEDSFAFLEKATGGLQIRTFCYPYGGFHSFTPTTERLLDELGCRFAFNVEARDIEPADLENRRQALPRYDCNRFAHGAAHLEYGKDPG